MPCMCGIPRLSNSDRPIATTAAIGPVRLQHPRFDVPAPESAMLCAAVLWACTLPAPSLEHRRRYSRGHGCGDTQRRSLGTRHWWGAHQLRGPWHRSEADVPHIPLLQGGTRGTGAVLHRRRKLAILRRQSVVPHHELAPLGDFCDGIVLHVPVGIPLRFLVVPLVLSGNLFVHHLDRGCEGQRSVDHVSDIDLVRSDGRWLRRRRCSPIALMKREVARPVRAVWAFCCRFPAAISRCLRGNSTEPQRWAAWGSLWTLADFLQSFHAASQLGNHKGELLKVVVRGRDQYLLPRKRIAVLLQRGALSVADFAEFFAESLKRIVEPDLEELGALMHELLHEACQTSLPLIHLDASSHGAIKLLALTFEEPSNAFFCLAPGRWLRFATAEVGSPRATRSRCGALRTRACR
mmetsp:Transcript_79308/g.220552  ORF Transcript_79308/g.220552 Transcript_79308/m.220552 type:complete len:407 (-) Transcript_79308:251-1471(-)